jgi:hypothetical protein
LKSASQVELEDDQHGMTLVELEDGQLGGA